MSPRNCYRYPRSHDRGPIEARSWRLSGFSDTWLAYPRSHDRGPIEAGMLRGGLNVEGEAYPRSHDRGPIEAITYRVATEKNGSRPIRGHMTAAPLKPRIPFPLTGG